MTPNSHPLDQFLWELNSHYPLEHCDRRAILDLPLRIRELDPGTYLIREGGLPVNCTVLIEGFAFRQKLTGDGSRQIMAISIPGDAVDLQNMFLNVSDHAVQMLSRGTVGEFKRSDVQSLALARPAIGAAIIKSTLVEASILREWVVNVGRRDARERIAHILCEFAVRLEARDLSARGFELPMTQEQLADATGLTPVHVNRVLKGLEAEGLIKRQRRAIQFPDWRRLQQAGDFSRQYLHLARDELATAA